MVGIMKFKANCMYTDRPNKNGLKYDKETLLKAVDKYKDRISAKASINMLNAGLSVDLVRASHVIDRIDYDGKKHTIYGHTLNGMQSDGPLLATLLEAGAKLDINPNMVYIPHAYIKSGYIHSIIQFSASSEVTDNEDNRITIIEE